MGADFDSRVYTENLTASQLRERFADDIESARHNSGHGGYTGTIAEMGGIATIKCRLFSSLMEAESYISETHKKWEDAIAVSFSIAKERTDQQKKTLEESRLAYLTATDRLDDFVKKLHTTFRERKRPFVTCSNCKSRLKRELIVGQGYGRPDARVPYIKDGKALAQVPGCPLCRDTFISAADEVRIEKHRDRIARLRNKFLELNEPPTSNKIGWIVGGLCSS